MPVGKVFKKRDPSGTCRHHHSGEEVAGVTAAGLAGLMGLTGLWVDCPLFYTTVDGLPAGPISGRQ